MKLSIVLTIYNKSRVIPMLIETIHQALSDTLSVNNYEIIFVDDNSTDDTVELLKKYEQADHIKILQLTSNTGQLIAFEHGLKAAKGEMTIMTSGDMQNPLHLSKEMYNALLSGHDCVIAYRDKRNDWGIKALFSLIFLRILSFIFRNFPKGGFDFVAFNSEIKDKLLKMDFSKIFFQLELLDIVKNPKWIPVTRSVDDFGISQWNYSKRLSYALKAVKYILKRLGL